MTMDRPEHQFAIVRYPGGGVLTDISFVDWKDGAFTTTHKLEVEIEHSHAADNLTATLAAAMPASLHGQAVRYAIDDLQGAYDTVPLNLEALARDWTPEQFHFLIEGNNGGLKNGMFWMMAVEGSHRFSVIDVEGEPLRIDVTTMVVEEMNDICLVESLEFAEQAVFDRASIGWSEVDAYRAQGKNFDAIETARKIFYEKMNTTLKHAVISPLMDMRNLVLFGRIQEVTGHLDPTSISHYTTAIETFLGATEAEMQRLVNAAFAAFSPDAPANVIIDGCGTQDAHAAGAYALKPEEYAACDKAMIFLHERVAPHAWPIGWDVHFDEEKTERILSSYYRFPVSYQVVRPAATGHDTLEEAVFLKEWLAAKNRVSMAEAEAIIDAYL
jgi:hypothetical protein